MVKDCLSLLMKHCLKKEEAELISMDDHITSLRTNISFILTKHIGTIPYYITEKIDKILQKELLLKPSVPISSVTTSAPFEARIKLYEGNMFLLQADCIVNPASPSGLGCMIPGHECLDSQIHLKAGPKMREVCKAKLAGKTIECSELIVTTGFNLLSKYVFHAVGPVCDQNNHGVFQKKLIKTYSNCLDEAARMKLGSIVFPCISAEESGFPRYEACVLALSTIRDWLAMNDTDLTVIICPTNPEDIKVYKQVLESEIWFE